MPVRYRSMSIGKSRVGRQSPYQDDFSAPPRPNSSIIGSSIVIVGSGTPTWTSVPARSRAKNACRYVSGRPTASMTTSAPLPSVSALIASTGSVSAAVDGVGGAEAPGPLQLAGVDVDGDDRAGAGQRRARRWRRRPRRRSRSRPRCRPGRRRRCSPRRRSRPSPRSRSGRPPRAGPAGSTFTHWPAATSVSSAKAPMPSAGDSGVPSASVIVCVALARVEAVPGPAPPAGAARAARRPPGDDDVVAGGDAGRRRRPTASTTPAASWPSRNGKSSLMPPSR